MFVEDIKGFQEELSCLSDWKVLVSEEKTSGMDERD